MKTNIPSSSLQKFRRAEKQNPPVILPAVFSPQNIRMFFKNPSIFRQKAYLSLLRISDRCVTVLLGLLGFGLAACQDHEVEYGSPYATYEIKGKVMNEAGDPVRDIRVDYVEIQKWEGREIRDTLLTVRTDAGGNFGESFGGFPMHGIHLFLTDTDGPANGSYVKDSLYVSWTNDDFRGGKGWYEGIVSKELPPLILKEKKHEENAGDPETDRP